ncbi:unnamed protein product [Caenorhabditis brenneri]
MEFPCKNLLQQVAWDRYLRDIEDNQLTTRFNYFLLFLGQIQGRGRQLDDERAPEETQQEMERRVNEAVEDIFRDFIIHDGQPDPEDAHLMPQPYKKLVINAFYLRYFRLVAAMPGDRFGWITHFPVMRYMAEFQGEILNTQLAERRAQRALENPGAADEVETREEMDRRVNEVIEPIFEEIRASEEERIRRREEDRRRELEAERAREFQDFLEDQFDQRFNLGRRTG